MKTLITPLYQSRKRIQVDRHAVLRKHRRAKGGNKNRTQILIRWQKIQKRQRVKLIRTP
jgi:hypothetical protein